MPRLTIYQHSMSQLFPAHPDAPDVFYPVGLAAMSDSDVDRFMTEARADDKPIDVRDVGLIPPGCYLASGWGNPEPTHVVYTSAVRDGTVGWRQFCQRAGVDCIFYGTPTRCTLPESKSDRARILDGWESVLVAAACYSLADSCEHWYPVGVIWSRSHESAREMTRRFVEAAPDYTFGIEVPKHWHCVPTFSWQLFAHLGGQQIRESECPSVIVYGRPTADYAAAWRGDERAIMPAQESESLGAVFRIARMESRGVQNGWYDGAGQGAPSEYDSPREAATTARELNESQKRKGESARYAVKRIAMESDDGWRAREAAKFARGEYVVPPFLYGATGRLFINRLPENTDFFQHYLHVSAAKPNMVAFTESADKGRDDKQKRMRPGRYLTDTFKDTLENSMVRDWAGTMAPGDYLLKFAHTPDDIESVYERGPGSCMSGAANRFCTGGIHPTRIYGAGDLAVAYLESCDGDDSDDGEVYARALCWPAKKLYGRIYPDYGSAPRVFTDLRESLENRGYVETDGGFDGAKVLRIERGGDLVGPYFDSETGIGVRDNGRGQYLVIVGHGEPYTHTCCSTNGYIESGHTCAYCEEPCDTDYSTYVENYGEVCESCFSEHFFHCEHCESAVHDDGGRSVTNVDGHERFVCLWCCERHYRACDECGDSFESLNGATNKYDSDVEVCDSCLENEYSSCDDCGGAFENGTALNDDLLCYDCAPDDSESESAAA